MKWLESSPHTVVPPVLHSAVLRRRLERGPATPDLQQLLGDALSLTGDWHGAIAAYEAARASHPGSFGAWVSLARAYRQLGDYETALRTCLDAGTGSVGARLWLECAQALRLLGRPNDAHQALMSAVALGDFEYQALMGLFAPLAASPDGGRLLDFCDALPAPLQDATIVTAHRAIALSRLGRRSEATDLVNLNDDVTRATFEPPSEFGGLDEFNRLLTREILSETTGGATVSREGFTIDYHIHSRRSPAFKALFAFIRSQMADRLARLSAGNSGRAMPESGFLDGAAVVLRGSGRNGEHIHRLGYLSSVYYVAVPDEVLGASDTRGALALGTCVQYTAGHHPCWGTAYVRPLAGTLVMFPSHLFHDVVPTATDQPRISIAVDLVPMAVGTPGLQRIAGEAL